MKFIHILIVAILIFSIPAQAQILDPEAAAKRKAEQRTNQKINRGMDKAFDKAEDGVISIFKKKDKKEKEEEAADETETTAESKKESGNQHSEIPAKKGDSGLMAYSKFDFIPGEKVVAYEDFSQDAIGDFPARWNSNTSGEVVTLDGYEGKWLNISQNGVFYPEFLGVLPENFTLEMMVGFDGAISNNSKGIILGFVENNEKLLLTSTTSGKNLVGLSVHPAGANSAIDCRDGAGKLKLENTNKQTVWNKDSPVAKLSVWRQKGRLRLYIDDQKIWDIPKAFESGVDYTLIFERSYFYEGSFFISDVRVAVGAPDTRSKLLTEGRLVTRGIAFDVGSAKIRSESYPVLKEIAAVLSENPELKINIIGHTDTDGNAASNLELSKKRAASVAEALQKEFSIPAGQMKTDGKGDAEPSEPNTSAQGKANNRRVEFVKI